MRKDVTRKQEVRMAEITHCIMCWHNKKIEGWGNYCNKEPQTLRCIPFRQEETGVPEWCPLPKKGV